MCFVVIILTIDHKSLSFFLFQRRNEQISICYDRHINARHIYSTAIYFIVPKRTWTQMEPIRYQKDN